MTSKTLMGGLVMAATLLILLIPFTPALASPADRVAAIARAGARVQVHANSNRRDDRRDYREDRRDERGDYREERREDKRDYRDGNISWGDHRRDRRDDARDYRGERRDNRRDYHSDRRDDWSRGRDLSYENNRWSNDGRWSNDWRRDSRYDWQRYRTTNTQLYRTGRYDGPFSGHSYRRIGTGFTLGTAYYGNRYWLDDPSRYRLPTAYGPYRWVRYYNDVLLIDVRNGLIVDAINNFFW